ncbi:MAG: hypothetical protein ABR562_02260 [Thermoplasmatota archaeon]
MMKTALLSAMLASSAILLALPAQALPVDPGALCDPRGGVGVCFEDGRACATAAFGLQGGRACVDRRGGAEACSSVSTTFFGNCVGTGDVDCPTTTTMQYPPPPSHCTVKGKGITCGTSAGHLSWGYSCTLLGFDCTQSEWGVHTSQADVGGGNGCNAGATVHPDPSAVVPIVEGP